MKKVTFYAVVEEITHLDPFLLCRLFWLSVDEQEHQADDDE